MSTMIEHVVQLRPASVMDVGCGYGKWGFLVREALDFVGGRHTQHDRSVRIDGIDAYPVESPLLDWVYDSVTTGEVMDEEISGYDLVVMGDVIEHIPKRQGREIVDELLARNRCVLVNTPREFFQQEILDNPYETHRSFWTAKDFARWPADVDIRGGTLTVALRGVGGTYPTREAVRASALVQRVPGLRSRGSASAAAKEVLRSYVFGSRARH
jgi:hypothetical protein